jgi:hypothetical protein
MQLTAQGKPLFWLDYKKVTINSLDTLLKADVTSILLITLDKVRYTLQFIGQRHRLLRCARNYSNTDTMLRMILIGCQKTCTKNLHKLEKVFSRDWCEYLDLRKWM